MKIRIKGASLRLRLSKSEVATIVHQGLLTEETPFGASTFRYSLARVEDGNQLSAGFEDGNITMYVPESLIKDWDTNSLISIEGNMPVGADKNLYLLLEKDFQCIDQTTEDQSDNYINPNQSC
jgi:hypothetical protein